MATTAGRGKPQLSVKLILATGLLWASGILVSFPFIWSIRSSVMTAKEILKFPPIWIPSTFTLENYQNVLSYQPFGRYIFNSLFVACSVTLLQLLIAAMGGYAFARLRFPGRDKVFLLYLATMIIPPQVTLVPQYVLISRLGWIDSYAALIIPSVFSAFLTFLFRQFFLSIPRDLEDSARIDGAGYTRIFLTVILPLSGPIIATGGLLAFMSSWTSFLWPLIVLRTRELRTVPIGLAALRDEMGTTDYAQIMAGSVLAILPMFILFVFLQRYIIQGIASSGLKG